MSNPPVRTISMQGLRHVDDGVFESDEQRYVHGRCFWKRNFWIGFFSPSGIEQHCSCYRSLRRSEVTTNRNRLFLPRDLNIIYKYVAHHIHKLSHNKYVLYSNALPSCCRWFAKRRGTAMLQQLVFRVSPSSNFFSNLDTFTRLMWYSGQLMLWV